jgi:hypothetical protein
VTILYDPDSDALLVELHDGKPASSPDDELGERLHWTRTGV